MKSNICIVSVIMLLSSTFAGCNDLRFGDDFLDKAPGVDVTVDTIFSAKVYADRALTAAYATLRCGLSIYNPSWYGSETDIADAGNRLGSDNLDALTDLIETYCTWGGVFNMYYSGQYDASIENWNTNTKFGFNPSQDLAYRGIRRAFQYIENVDRVPDMSEDEKTLRKGEAYMVIACQYHELMRHFGGVPILRNSIDVDSDGNTDYTRQPVSEVAKYILEICDKAASILPWTVSAADDGRFTKAAALGLKCRVLQYLASPIFNASEPYMQMGSPTGGNISKLNAETIPYMVWLGNFDIKRWQDVVEACREFLEENERNGNAYRLVENPADPRKAFSRCYSDRHNGEIIIATGRHAATYRPYYHTVFFGPTDEPGQSRGWGAGCNTLNFVDLFPYADGKPALYRDWISHNGHEGTLSDNPFVNRDPRLYESVMIAGDSFQGRLAEMWIGGRERQQATNVRAITGFCTRKFIWDYNATTLFNIPSNYAYLRLPEIYLIYAEALNELGHKEEAYQWLNKTRKRVGLPDMNDSLLDELQAGKTLPSYPEATSAGDPKLREEILDERAREFYFEETRWFDMVRWKRADIFQKTLYGITIELKEGSSSTNPEGLIFSDPTPLNAWLWKKNWSPKWYFSAFPSNEVNKGYGLIQNPGW